MNILAWLGVLAQSWANTAASPVPDFLASDSNLGGQRTLVLVPPAKHHLNLDAPMFARVGSVELKRLAAKHNEVRFALSATPGAIVVASAFLCDDDNKYCIKKTLSGTLGSKPGGLALKEISDTGAPGLDRVFRGEKHGFIYNDPQKALALAKKTGKPMLIDFYGIWCPPCNVLDESVFPTAAFKKSGAKFVRLKLDADAATSWALKDRYKVGGYPTILLTDAQGEEISRIVGSRRVEAFIKLVDQAWTMRHKPISALSKMAEAGNSDAQYRLGIQALERTDFVQAEAWLAKASQSWKSEDPRFERLYEARIRSLREKSKSASESRQKLVEVFQEAIKNSGTGYWQLQWAVDLAELQGDLNKKPEQKGALESAVSIAKKILAQPKILSDSEAGVEDIWVMLADAQKELGLEQEAKQSFAEAAKVYDSLIKGLGARAAENERGWNLERAYCLKESGQVELSAQLYEKLEKAFPEEFTFYYAHARLLLDLKKYPDAQAMAERALSFSYGDNRLRAAQTLAQIKKLRGDKSGAKSVIQEALSSAEIPVDPLNRTHRYIASLKKLEQDL